MYLHGKEKYMRKREFLKRIIIILSVFLCTEVCTFMYLFTSGDNSYTRHLDLGNKYILSEDYDDAIKAFTKAIAIDEKKEDAYIGRGDAYKAKGDYASAWDDYEKAQELSGDTDLLRNKIGETKISVVSESGEGIDGAVVRLIGADHNYEFLTDSSGLIAEVIFPEEYKVEVKKDDYELLRTELSAEKGGFVAEQIQLSNAEDGELLKEDKEALLEEYKGFIGEQSDAGAYMIYDIDKDTYPELFFRHILPEEREAYYDIYTYKDGKFSFLERAYGAGLWHTLPIFASYPDGNGVIEYGAAKGKEYISIERWIDGTRESETLYSGEYIGQYYRDADDQAYMNSENGDAQINHQYYQSETSSPYFEGSYLLGQNSMDNYTALYEALGA